MRAFRILFAAMLAAISPLQAQAQNSEVIQVSPDLFLRWYGHAGRTYFVQISDPNDHLKSWTWAPIIETGNDEDISYEVDGTADKGFFRLCFTDEPTADPDGGDFDGDGLSNLAEVTIHQTNPLNPDTDGDGMPDGWEVYYTLNPLDAADGSLDPDNDGLTNAQEYQHGTNPNLGDSDGDGVTDGGEVDEGTDPTDPLDTPEAEWVILTGDLDEDEEATKSRTITIPAGQKRLILVGVSSDEYPCYTSGECLDENGEPFVFNDLVSWVVTPSAGDALSGGFDVNSRHADWEEEEERNFSLKGFGPAVLEEAETYEAPSDQPLTIEIDLTATNIGDGALPSTVIVGILPVDAIPDWDRDGSITEADRGKATEDQPWFWWINDDDSDAAEPHFGDVPEQGIDNADQFVNGPRDLVDYFPVKLDIKALLEVFPPADNEYRLIHPNGAINFVEMPDIQPESSRIGNGAGSFLANETVAIDALTAPHKSTVGAEGGLIGEDFLTACENGAGVLLLEGIQGDNQPLELLITTKPGQGPSNLQKKQRAKAKALRLEIQACEQLIWRGDIRPAAYGNPVGGVQQPADARWRNQLKDRWFVFCHGYNVSAEAARGWNTQVFKRLRQYGSDAKFVGISWEGNQGQINPSLPFLGGKTPDYWNNVDNAIRSASELTGMVNGLSGNDASKVVISGHSLGNMLVSSAFCDQNLKASQYFMLNAAVSQGAYASANILGANALLMRNPDWNNYANRLWSADFWGLYVNTPTDGRHALKWRDRFLNLPDRTNPHNYYSSGDQVLDNSDGSIPNVFSDIIIGNGRLAWAKQEMGKGLATQAAVQMGQNNGNWVSRGGWRFNNFYQGLSEAQANAIPDADLRTNPFFHPFATVAVLPSGRAAFDPNGTDVHGQNGSAHAAIPAVRSWLLANEIPAISFAAGRNQTQFSGGGNPAQQNTDMESLANFSMGDWKHSDLKDRHADHVWRLYQDFVQKGNLKK